MSDTKDVFESERARLDKKYKELTNNRVKSFVKQAGSTDAARDVRDIFVELIWRSSNPRLTSARWLD